MVAGPTELIVVLGVLGLLFGAKKVPEVANAVGRAQGEFEKGRASGEETVEEFFDEE